MRERAASQTLGTPHRHYRRTDSTNTRARELATAGAPSGTVITADEQTAGRGRQGRTWSAPPGSSLLYSAILRPGQDQRELLSLAVPLAVCEAAEDLLSQTGRKLSPRLAVKWPNDVLLDGRKLAGVLIESRPADGWVVIGIGLNLTITEVEFPPELRQKAISLFASSARISGEVRRSVPICSPPDLPRKPRATSARESLNQRLAQWVNAQPDEVLTAWRNRDALHGKEVSWETGTGVAEGVDERGYLLVRVADGDLVALGAGEVHLRL